MRRIRRQLLMIPVALFVSSALADSPIDCVDPDIVNTLLGMPGQGQVEINRTLPGSFPAIEVPSNFELIGSRPSPYFTMVSYRAASSVDDSRDRLRSLMEDAEWQFPERNIPGIQGGFQSTQSQQIQAALSMCHDDMGQLSVMFADAPGDGTYVTLMATPQNQPSQCAQMQQRSALAFQIPAMPTLKLPKDAKSKGSGFGGVSSSGDGASTRIQLETSLGTSELLAFFNQQLTEQDWSQDGSWIGLRTSGSAWLSDDEKRSGLLSIFDQGDSSFKLVFQTTLQTGGGSRSSIAIRRR